MTLYEKILSILKQSIIMRPIKKVIYYSYKKYLGFKKDVIFKSGVIIDLNVVFEGQNVLYENVSFINSILGYGSYIANGSKINRTQIGRFCSIASNVKIIIGKHPTQQFVSTHPAFFSLMKQAGVTFVDKQLYEEFNYADEEKRYFVIIGNDVWIGESVKIMCGVTIGDGAVIGSGAIITHDIEPYSINVGVPAKTIGYRFTAEQRAFLMRLKWWDRNLGWIKENVLLFSDISLFHDRFSTIIYDNGFIDPSI